MEENTNVELTNEQGADSAQSTETKTYTQEEVLALLQKESDKRVS